MGRESLMDTLDLSRTSVNELFADLLRETRGFKYFVTASVTFKKRVNKDLILEDLIFIQQ